MSNVLSVKAVKQKYSPSADTLGLLETFRQMVNHCVQLGLKENVTSLKSLSLKTYHQLSSYDTPSYYRLCAISKAVGILKNYRKAKRKNPKVQTPYAEKLMLTSCYGFKIENGKLRIPIKPHIYEYISLNKHTQQVLSDPDLTVRSITLTDSTVSISFSKETAEIEPAGLMGIDRNLDNLISCDDKDCITKFDLSKATKIKETYRQVKSHFKRNDLRVRRRIFRKYGVKQKNKVKQILHNVSKEIVNKALENKQAIVMENIKGIRKLYRKGNGQGRFYRGRMNSWSFHEFQRQIEYKAKWEGLPVIYVNARNTSKKCSICGLRLIPKENRMLKCPLHGVVDRDVNASQNIMKLGMRFVPVALLGEGMVAEPERQSANSIGVR